MKSSTAVHVSVLAVIALLFLGAEFDPYEQFSMILEWHKPKVCPRPMLEGMDIDTLNVLLDKYEAEKRGKE